MIVVAAGVIRFRQAVERIILVVDGRFVVARQRCRQVRRRGRGLPGRGGGRGGMRGRHGGRRSEAKKYSAGCFAKTATERNYLLAFKYFIITSVWINDYSK